MEGNIDFTNLDYLTSNENSEEYKKFVDKFKPKKTTDDCFTPIKIYEAVKEWAMKEYEIDEYTPIIRPFYPGGDYENYNYPNGCIVIDNPPFSILSKIIKFYISRNIKFFLFAPTMTMFGGNIQTISYIVLGTEIFYENGARVNTSFVTNMDEAKIRTIPKLTKVINEIQNTYKTSKKENKYPDNVVTGVTLGKFARHGIEIKIMPNQCKFIRRLDSQKESKRAIYGAGYLISEKAAQAKVEAEKIMAEKALDNSKIIWTLSDREKEIIKGLE